MACAADVGMSRAEVRVVALSAIDPVAHRTNVLVVAEERDRTRTGRGRVFCRVVTMVGRRLVLVASARTLTAGLAGCDDSGPRVLDVVAPGGIAGIDVRASLVLRRATGLTHDV